MPLTRRMVTFPIPDFVVQVLQESLPLGIICLFALLYLLYLHIFLAMSSTYLAKTVQNLIDPNPVVNGVGFFMLLSLISLSHNFVFFFKDLMTHFNIFLLLL